VAVSKGNEAGPVVVAPRRSHEALAVTRPVPSDQPYSPWGMLAAIDLHGCERSLLEDPGTLRRFVPSLINAIGMRAHGPLMLDRFGDGELEGWSALQFIETSSITVHTDEVCGRCFVDVFSCRPFDSGAAAAVAVAHFGGTFTLRVLHR
jgi:S-adenosylmethionine/arginine decarboxylase-like enzyme